MKLFIDLMNIMKAVFRPFLPCKKVTLGIVGDIGFAGVRESLSTQIWATALRN